MSPQGRVILSLFGILLRVFIALSQAVYKHIDAEQDKGPDNDVYGESCQCYENADIHISVPPLAACCSLFVAGIYKQTVLAPHRRKGLHPAHDCSKKQGGMRTHEQQRW